MTAKGDGKPVPKSKLIAILSEKTGLSRKEVTAILEALTGQISAALGPSGPGTFILPGLLKMVVRKRPAQPERTGVNPFTKQPQVFKAKPARNVVKVLALKQLRQLA